MDDIFARQEATSVEMANHLLSLTKHYDQMVQALHDCEAGIEFSEADLQGGSVTRSAQIILMALSRHESRHTGTARYYCRSREEHVYNRCRPVGYN